MSFLFDHRGNRKYLNAKERRAFLNAARQIPPEVRTFCITLAYTGCRISEALNLVPSRIDVSEGFLIFESLKKRRLGVFRAIPIPQALVLDLENTHGVRASQRDAKLAQKRLWPWCRTTAWSHVKRCMAAAYIEGPQAIQKGYVTLSRLEPSKAVSPSIS